jgi:hypothetical protein
MWEKRPARMRVEVETRVFIDHHPKVGVDFGMIVPVTYYESFVEQYNAAVSPQAFMEAVQTAFESGAYAPFEMAALHVVGDMAFLYRLKTTFAQGNISKKIGISASGMILTDTHAEWLSESFKTSE